MPTKAKYSLILSETKLYNGKMVYRIQANNSFGTVKRFQKGGWIEDENNLSHSGTCWVSDDAIVCGNAKVMDDAQVQQTAVVHQNAQVSGCAKISDNARVRGNAKVFGYARIYGNACLKDNAKAFGSCDVFGKALVYENAEISGSAEVSGISQIGGNDKIELGIYKDYKTHRSPSDKVRLNTDTGVLETLDDKGNKIVPLDKTKLAAILKRLKIDTSDATLNQFKNCITLRNRKTLISVLRNLLPNEKLETIKIMSKKILNEYYEVTSMYAYRGQIIEASTKEEAIKKIINKPLDLNRLSQIVREAGITFSNTKKEADEIVASNKDLQKAIMNWDRDWIITWVIKIQQASKKSNQILNATFVKPTAVADKILFGYYKFMNI